MDNLSPLADIDAGSLESEHSRFACFNHGLSIDPDAKAIEILYQSADHLQHLRARPDQPHEYSHLSWTYADMQFAAMKVVWGLRAHRIGPKSMLVAILPNGLEYALLYWASMIGKFTFVVHDPDVLTAPRSGELQNLLKDTLADAVVVAESSGALAVDTALSALSNGTIKIVLNPEIAMMDWKNFATVVSVAVNE